MVLKYVTKEIGVEVDIDLNDFDTDELIEEIEGRGDWLVVDKNDSDFTAPKVTDGIFNFYQDYLLWREFGMKNENFENIANKFFEEQLDIIVN